MIIDCFTKKMYHNNLAVRQLFHGQNDTNLLIGYYRAPDKRGIADNSKIIYLISQQKQMF